jgi:hypothetical protein
MTHRITGRYESTAAGGEEIAAFVPFPLPPSAPPLAIEGKLDERLRQAEQPLARLDLAGEMVPSIDWFIYAFVRKEAVVSSQIEGTQATLVDLLAFEAEEQAAPQCRRGGNLQLSRCAHIARTHAHEAARPVVGPDCQKIT